MAKPKVDITEANGAKWSMAKLAAEALGTDSKESNIFLSQFNKIAIDASDEDIIRVLQRWVVLVYDGEEIGALDGEEPATVEVVSEALSIPDDAEQRDSEAGEYLEGIKAVEVESAGYRNTIVLLADTKEMISAIDEKRKYLTKGARETVSRVDAEFKPAIADYKQAEAILKDKLLEYRGDVRSIRTKMLAAGEEPNVEAPPEVEGVSVRSNVVTTVFDEDLVPDKFWIQTIDVGAIAAALENGEDVPGARSDVNESLAITVKKVQR